MSIYADNPAARAPVPLWWVYLLAAAWILPGLVGHDPWKPDEAYTFGIVYHMTQGGDWVVPSLAQEPFMEKPPLYYLSAAAVAALFSHFLPLHDAARLTTGVYMALTLLFVGLTARELYGRGYGRIAALTLLGCIGLVVRCHQLITDISLLTGFAAGFYGLALALRRPLPGGFWLGTGVGVGFMSKGLLAPGVFGIVALLLPLFPAWRTRQYPACLAAAAAACAPWLTVWPLALYRRSRELFDEWFWVNNFGRFLGSNDLGPHAEHSFYLGILPWYALPALPLAAWVLWRTRGRGWLEPNIALPLTAFAVLFAVLSASADARELYALPMLLPLTLLATPATDTLRRGASNLIYWFSVMSGCFFVLVAWFYWAALEFGIPADLHRHLHAMQPGYAPGFRWLPFTFGALYTVAWIVLLARLKRGPRRPIIAWVAAVTVLWGLAATLFIGWVDTGKSYRSMIAGMQKALPARYRCISSQDLGEPQRAMLEYFAGIVTYRQEVPERRHDCSLLLVQGNARVERPPSGAWRKIWESARPGDDYERYRLYRRVE